MAFKEKIIEIYGKIGTGPKIILLIIVLLVIGFKLGRVGRSVGTHADHTGDAVSSSNQKSEWWTCSMHPQIKKKQPGLCPICNMDLIPLTIDDTQMGSMHQLVVSEDAKKLMDIEVAPVERKFVEADIRMVGKIDFDETNLAYITAWFPGRIDKLYVDYTGVSVKKGDHMAYMYSPELISAQEELLQALEAVKNMKRSELGVMKEMTAGNVEASREKLRLWGLTPEQIAEIEKTGKVTDHMTIYSQTSGIVIHKNALEGMYVETGTKIYTIADLTKIWVMLDAYESDLQWLRYGQQVQFTTVAYPGLVFKGTISFIDPILNEKTRTVNVRVNVANPEGKLKPGMFVKAIASSTVAGGGKIMDPDLAGKWICPMHPEIIKDGPGKCDICEMPLVRTEELGYTTDDPSTVEKPLVIPVTAALVTGTRAIVYVRIPDTEKPTFEGKEIVLGPRAGDYYLVRSGLKEGDLVVVNGEFKIDSSLQIMAKPSMMTPEGAGLTDEHEHTASQRESISDDFRTQLADVFAGYFTMQKALANDNPDLAARSAKDMSLALKAVDMKLLKGSDHDMWMKNSSILKETLASAIEAKDIDTLRKNFDPISQQMVNIAGHFGSVIGKEVYVAHCPMAFDNAGADWIQDDKEIRNPYFGAKMFKCGSVEKVVAVKDVWKKTDE